MRVPCAAVAAGLGAITLFLVAAVGTTMQLTRPLIPPAAAESLAGKSATAFVRPVLGSTITQGFGCSPYQFEPIAPTCASRHWHSGIDLAAPSGRPVVAALGGQVRLIASVGGFGLHIVIEHGSGLTTLYGHLSVVVVSDGDWVAQGAVVGGVGSTGNSTGPHLHFEVRRDGIAEDPLMDLTLP